jgi:YfiH family protein
MPAEKPSQDTPLVRAALLDAAGFAHGFSTRCGGVSPAPYASLNLGGAVGDRPDYVAENLRRFGAAVGFDPTALHQVFQVHGRTVHRPGRGDAPGQSARVEADAVLASEAGVAVGIRVADCVPVLVGDPETGRAVAVHAGWRGVVAGVVAEAVAALEAPDRGGLVAAVGPCIGPCCFEVGDEVAQAIAGASEAGVVVRGKGPKPHVDLRRAVAAQLASLGVVHQERVGGCTVCEADRWFSFRREGLHSGRMLAVIVARAARGKIAGPGSYVTEAVQGVKA